MVGFIMGSIALCATVLPHVSLPHAALLPHALKEQMTPRVDPTERL